MRFLNEWTYTICITLIISVIFSLLLPKGSQGKVGRIVITVFIMISFFIPFGSNNFKLNFDDYSIEYSDENTLKETSYENIIKSNIESTLTKGNYKNSKAEVKVDIKDEQVYIKSADVYILNEFNKDEVKNYIFDKLGINTKVYYIGE